MFRKGSIVGDAGQDSGETTGESGAEFDIPVGGSGTPLDSNDPVASLVNATLADEIGLTPHIDLDLGPVDEATLEPVLYRLLGVAARSTLLVGVSRIDVADLVAAREAWGDPVHQVDLHRGAQSPLSWDIWRMPAHVFIEGTIVGASLVLPEIDPSWMLFIEPSEDDAMLFTCPRPCSRHR
jgi:hypothetical protein